MKLAGTFPRNVKIASSLERLKNWIQYSLVDKREDHTICFFGAAGARCRRLLRVCAWRAVVGFSRRCLAVLVGGWREPDVAQDNEVEPSIAVVVEER